MAAAIWTGNMIGSFNEAKNTTAWQIKYDAEHQAKQLLSKQNTEYYEAARHSITRDQFKDMFAESFILFSKNLKLKDIEHFTKVNTVTESNINTAFHDSTIVNRDTTHVKAFAYSDTHLRFSGYATADSLLATYKYYLSLQIAEGKKQRQGWWKKITLQPLKREKIVNAITGDTNTVITNLETYKIK